MLKWLPIIFGMLICNILSAQETQEFIVILPRPLSINDPSNPTNFDEQVGRDNLTNLLNNIFNPKGLGISVEDYYTPTETINFAESSQAIDFNPFFQENLEFIRPNDYIPTIKNVLPGQDPIINFPNFDDLPNDNFYNLDNVWQGPVTYKFDYNNLDLIRRNVEEILARTLPSEIQQLGISGQTFGNLVDVSYLDERVTFAFENAEVASNAMRELLLSKSDTGLEITSLLDNPTVTFSLLAGASVNKSDLNALDAVIGVSGEFVAITEGNLYRENTNFVSMVSEQRVEVISGFSFLDGIIPQCSGDIATIVVRAIQGTTSGTVAQFGDAVLENPNLLYQISANTVDIPPIIIHPRGAHSIRQMQTHSDIDFDLIDIGLSSTTQKGEGITVVVLDTASFNDGEYEDTHTTYSQGHGLPIMQLIREVAPEATVMPYKVCDDDGKCDFLTVYLGLCTALAHQITDSTSPSSIDLQKLQNLVVNLSFGGEEPDETLLGILQSAAEYNVLVAVAAQNPSENGDIPDQPHYPAYYSSSVPGLVAVTASEYGSKESFVDVSTQGIFSGGYEGTSFATPLVAGTLALMRQAAPKVSVADLKSCFTDSNYVEVNGEVGTLNVDSLVECAIKKQQNSE